MKGEEGEDTKSMTTVAAIVEEKDGKEIWVLRITEPGATLQCGTNSVEQIVIITSS